MSALLAVSQPPLGEPAHETATYMFTVFLGVFFVGLVAVAVRIATRERTALPVACLLGGLLSFAFEPVLDATAHIFYPLGSPLTAVTIFETTIPWFVVMAYVFWVGVGSYLVMRYLERGPRGTDVMRLFLLVCLIEPLFEYPAVLSKALIYYGDQPFKVFDFPLYWPFANTAPVFVAGYALLLARPYLRGPRGFAIAALIPALAFFAANGAGSWPVWLALNSEVGMAVVWLAGAVAIGLHVSFVRLVAWGVDRGLTSIVPAQGQPEAVAPRARSVVRSA